MDPLNKNERKTAVSRFFWLYALSLAVVILAAYFLFNTPASIFKNKVQLYKTTEDEQGKLLDKIDGMTANLNNLVQVDKNYWNSANEIEKGNLQTKISEYQKNINNALVDVQNDSASFVSFISKKNSYNYITVFNTILSYRNTVGSLQNSLLAKGGDASELIKARSDLQACSMQLEIAKLAAAAASSKPVPVPSGGGGGGSNNAKETALQAQLQKAQDDLEACKKEKATMVVPQPSGKNNLSDAQKAIVLFDAGSELYNKAEATKNLIEKRGVLSSARELFQKSSPAYPEADKVNKAIKQIELELKKLSNMG